MAITEKLTLINTVKNDIKAAIETRGINMANVTFPEYASKIKLITDETVLYNSGSWNSEYSHATYIPSGGSITENDTYISIVGGGVVPQIGFTLKDSDIDRTFYALVKPALYSSSTNVNYRFGVGYQNTAVTSSSGGTTIADTTSIPHNARCLAGPMIISIPVRSKYAKIFVAGSQTCKIYKMWLGKKYSSISAGDEIVTGVQFLPITSSWTASSHLSTSGTSSFEFYNPTFVVAGKLNNGDSFDIEGHVIIEAYNPSTSTWDVLLDYKTGDVYAGSSRSFSFTYTHSGSTTYTRWRLRKGNASNTASLSTAYISSYVKKTPWVLKTGNLVTMTSNSAPAPYTCSYSGHDNANNAYKVFNNNNSDGVDGGSNHDWNGWSTAQLNFGKTIKISKFSYVTQNELQWVSDSNFRTMVLKVRNNDTWTSVYEFGGDATGKLGTSGSGSIEPIECDAIQITWGSSPHKSYMLYTFKITEWYEKA